MGPARRSVPVALRLLGGLTVRLLLLLLLCPPAAQGDCSLPPDVPNAHPILSNGVKNFPEGSTVTYKCNKGFVKVPGKTDSVVCLSNNQWSEMAEFCNRSCDVPPILRFALLKKSFSIQNYFPEGFTVEYECRQGYRRDHTLSGKLTCLQNFTWSKSEEFCKKKSCATPGNIEYGHVSITTDILYGASIFFSCNTGYRLVGADSSFCYLSPNGTMEWSNPLPKCEEISCPEPQGIRNGSIQNPQKTYVNQQSVTYQCNEGFTLTGEHSIYCTVKNDRGEWSGPPPECKAKQSSAVAPRTTTHVHATSPQKERGTASSDANIIAVGLVAGTVIGTLILGKIIWHYGKSGIQMYNIDSFAYDASNHWLAALAEEEFRRKYTQVCRIFLVS
ncbi:complement decay-accelerating factor isoform X12 [Hyaena hyaena]|uniref:complement decay-accelerating factor isoform X12 n=1 Tax=Hyaena hyaena TaxID=95912 RepID=UPI001923DAD7|nr:complement decay-accelerating factor isoform X12 [Hyaena hyaena]